MIFSLGYSFAALRGLSSRFIFKSAGAVPMTLKLPEGMQINAPMHPRFDEILTPDALALVAKLHRAFEPRRQELLKARVARQARIDAGELPDFLPETRNVREGDWKIAPLPKALEVRRAEITGERKSPRLNSSH